MSYAKGYCARRLRPALGLALLAALVAVLTACVPADASGGVAGSSDDVSVTLMSFAAGTTGQVRIDAMAEAVRRNHPEWRVTSMQAGGEARFVEKRINREADFFTTMSPRRLELLVQEPLHPDIDFAAVTDYRIVMPASLMRVHFFALGNTGLVAPSDIVARKYPMRMGSGVGVIRAFVAAMFDYYGTTIEETEAWGARYETLMMASAEGVEALQSGRVDVGITWGALPQPVFMGMSFDVNLLRIDDPGLLARLEELDCVPSVIPAGTYPFVKSDVPTVGAPQYFVTRPEMSEDVVYNVVRAIYEHRELLYAVYDEARTLLTAESVNATIETADRLGQSFHPGALRFYRELGWID